MCETRAIVTHGPSNGALSQYTLFYDALLDLRGGRHISKCCGELERQPDTSAGRILGYTVRAQRGRMKRSSIDRSDWENVQLGGLSVDDARIRAE